MQRKNVAVGTIYQYKSHSYDGTDSLSVIKENRQCNILSGINYENYLASTVSLQFAVESAC